MLCNVSVFFTRYEETSLYICQRDYSVYIWNERSVVRASDDEGLFRNDFESPARGAMLSFPKHFEHSHCCLRRTTRRLRSLGNRR